MKKINQITNSNPLLNHIHILNGSISCKIFQNLGASLLELIVDDVEIIDGISITDQGISDYKNTSKSSILFPFPNRVENGVYKFNQTEHLLDNNESNSNNAIHGLVFDKSFTVEKSEFYNEDAIIELSYSSDGNLKGFPFPFKLNLTYIIYNNGNVSLTFEAINTGNTTFPFGMGWHPYFKTDSLEKSRISFPSVNQFICSDKNIPVGSEKSKFPASFSLKQKIFDDAFSLKRAKVAFETANYNLKMNFENKLEPYLQIYTPEHRNNIAIEPMTCIANSFNNNIGLQFLVPKASFSWKINLNIKTNT